MSNTYANGQPKFHPWRIFWGVVALAALILICMIFSGFGGAVGGLFLFFFRFIITFGWVICLIAAIVAFFRGYPGWTVFFAVLTVIFGIIALIGVPIMLLLG